MSYIKIMSPAEMEEYLAISRKLVEYNRFTSDEKVLTLDAALMRNFQTKLNEVDINETFTEKLLTQNLYVILFLNKEKRTNINDGKVAECCYLTMNELAEMLGCRGTRSIKRAIDLLVKMHLIIVRKIYNGKGKQYIYFVLRNQSEKLCNELNNIEIKTQQVEVTKVIEVQEALPSNIEENIVNDNYNTTIQEYDPKQDPFRTDY